MDVDAIRSALRRQPFQSFSMRLVDGREFPVPHPDFIAVSRRTVVVMDTRSGGFTVLEPVLIASLEGLHNGETASPSNPPPAG
jgi:hypothetical protein